MKYSYSPHTSSLLEQAWLYVSRMLAPEGLRSVACQKFKSSMDYSMGPYFLKENKSDQRMERMMRSRPSRDHTQEICFLEWDPLLRALPASAREHRNTMEPSDQFTANLRHKVAKSFPSCTYSSLDDSGLIWSGPSNDPSSVFHLLRRVTDTVLSRICSAATGFSRDEWARRAKALWWRGHLISVRKAKFPMLPVITNQFYINSKIKSHYSHLPQN